MRKGWNCFVRLAQRLIRGKPRTPTDAWLAPNPRAYPPAFKQNSPAGESRGAHLHCASRGSLRLVPAARCQGACSPGAPGGTLGQKPPKAQAPPRGFPAAGALQTPIPSSFLCGNLGKGWNISEGILPDIHVSTFSAHLRGAVVTNVLKVFKCWQIQFSFEGCQQFCGSKSHLQSKGESLALTFEKWRLLWIYEKGSLKCFLSNCCWEPGASRGSPGSGKPAAAEQTVSYPPAVRSAEGSLSLSAQVSSKRGNTAFSSIQLSLLSRLNAAETAAMGAEMGTAQHRGLSCGLYGAVGSSVSSEHVPNRRRMTAWWHSVEHKILF